MKKLFLPFLLVSFLVVSFSSYALPLGTSNILVSSDNMLFEYTPEGQIVQQIPIPPIPESLAQARDLIVTAGGEVAIFNGTFDPELSIYSPETEQWRSFKFPGWSIANNGSYGGIAAYGDGIYVTDMLTDGNGIVRFDFDGLAQRYLEGNEYTDLTLGLDGKFYAVRVVNKIDVIDPKTMQIINSFQPELAIDVRGVAVNAAGEIYAVSWDGELNKYDSNGLRLSTSPTVLNDLSDIDIDAQGRIVFQDRNNIVYITNEQFTLPQAINLPVVSSALSFVAFSKNDANVPVNPNILVSSDNRMLEYTPDGQLIKETPIYPIPENLAQARDLIVTKTGEIAFFNGTLDPELSLYNPQTDLWRSFKFPGWSIANNVSNGGIAAFDDYVYVTDMLTDGNGIVRFIFNGTALDGSAQRFMNGQDYLDLTVGLDGKLYALLPYGTAVDVIDPVTMLSERIVGLQAANDNRAIAVNKAGEIFAVNWNGELNKYDIDGFHLNSIPIAWNISDININSDGRIIIQDRYNNVFITDELGINPVVFPLPVPISALSFVAFAQNDVFGNSKFVDSDNDGIDDNWELQFALDPQDPLDATLDFDGDGLTNLEEFNASTDPWNFDSDSDGLSDGDEVNIYATDPVNIDTDSDGISDGYEVNNQLAPLMATDALLDKDGDGLNNLEEYDLGTSASSIDSDIDGVNDGEEVNQGLNPLDKDTDDDGLTDGEEIGLALNPLQRDSNNNGVIDGFEHGNIIRVNPSQSYNLAGSARSGGVAASSDGRYIAYVSESSNIVNNDTNGVEDVFWSDTLTGEVRRVSISSTGEEGNNTTTNSFGIDISDDGRFVAFSSYASNLVDNDTNNTSDIFVHDTQTAATTRVNVTSSGIQSNGSSYHASISANGRYVVFYSSSLNLLPGPDGNTGYETDIFVHDRDTGTTTLVSKNTEGVQGNHQSINPVISGNGRFVAFSSESDNLVENDTNGITSQIAGKDVFVHDLLTGVTQRVSISTEGIEGDNFSDMPSISGDGRYIAFHSLATTLDINVPVTYNAFVHDRITKQTNRIVIDEFEGAAYKFRNFPSISQSGRYIALRATHTAYGYHAVFVYDRVTGLTNMASRNNSGVELKYHNVGNDLAITDDGQFVAFSTTQRQLVPDKVDGVEEVFLAKTGFSAELASAPTAVIISVDTVYINNPIPFDASQSSDPNGDPLLFNWEFGDGTYGNGPFIDHVYPVSGTYTVTLRVFDGNTEIVETKIINVLTGAPVVILNAQDTVYINNPIPFDASQSSDPNGDPLNYFWDFGDGTSGYGITIDHVYGLSGTYTVTLSVFDGNTSSVATKEVSVLRGEPSAVILSLDSVNKNDSLIFDASLSTDPNGDPLSYQWDFGDGKTDVGITTVHVYAASGSYTISLTVFDGNTPTVTTKVITVVNQAPTPVISSVDTVDKNVSMLFDASLSTDPNGDALTYSWDFGDGVTAIGVTVNHTYSTTGMGAANVTLTVSDGETSTYVRKVITIVNHAPTPIITSSDTLSRNNVISFDASLSTDVDGDALTYHWNFGDGGLTSTSAIAERAYSISGSYTVTLTISDGAVVASTSKVITVVNQAPTSVIISGDTAKKNRYFAVDASSSTDPNDDTLIYSWDFGDGTVSSTGVTSQHYYPSSGSFTLILTVDDGEATTTTSKIITVLNQEPVALAVINSNLPVIKNSATLFDGQYSSDYNFDELTYSWDFGDGTPAVTGVLAEHTYTSGGNYSVILTVSDGESTGSTSKAIYVNNEAPVAVITAADTVNRNQSAIYDASLSTDQNGDSLSYSWNFGDGSLTQVTTNTSVNHVYALSGSYTVTLTVSDGEVSTLTSKVITVQNPAPNVVISAASSVNKNANAVYDASLSTDPNGDTLTYLWSFGDGTTATGVTVNHTYATSGNYTLTLTLSDGELSIVGFKVITVLNQAPTAIVRSADTVNKNVSAAFDAALSTDTNGDVLSYNWNFGDGGTATGTNVNHSYAVSGAYTATLTVSDGEASSSTNKTITVINQAPVANAGIDQTVVRRTIVTLDGSTSNDPDIGDSINYKWTQISGRTVTINNINSSVTTFEAPGVRRGRERELIFELEVTDDEGIRSVDTVLIVVTR